MSSLSEKKVRVSRSTTGGTPRLSMKLPDFPPTA
jgi:hypothetical protein